MRETQKKYIFLSLLTAVCIAGFLLRLTAGLQLMSVDPAVFAPSSATDMGTYKTISENILKGAFPQEFYYQPFYYAVFLPLIQIFTGPSDFMVVLAQSLCGAFAIFLTGLVGARLGGKKTGIFAAILLALSQIAILYTPYRLLEIMQSFWFILLLFATLKAMDKGGYFRWFLTGLVLAAAILSRGNAWCFLPPILLACYWGEFKFRQKSKKILLLSVLFLFLGTLLPQIPFATINSLKYGVLKGPSTAGSAVLALGNTKEAPPGGLEYPVSFNLWTHNEALRSVPMRIFDWFIEEPGAYLELTFRKLFLFWNEYDIPNNINPAASIQKSPLLSTLRFIPTGVLLMLCLAGVFLLFGRSLRKKRIFIFLFFLCMYWFAAAAFYNLGRFRIPALAFFCLAGGYFCAAVCSEWKAGRFRKLFLFNGFALLTAYFIVYPAYTLYRENLESSIIRVVRPHGIQVEVPGKGTLIYDHGPMSFGGWNVVKGNGFKKKFALEKGFQGSVEFSIAVLKTPEPMRTSVMVNGQQMPLDNLPAGKMAFLTFNLPYPVDGIFHIDLYGPVSAVADLQRNYARTFSVDGTPQPYELLTKIQLQSAGK